MEAQVKRLKAAQRKVLGMRRTRRVSVRRVRGMRPGLASFAPSRGGATYSRRMASGEKKNIDVASVALPAVATATGVITVLNVCTAGGLPTNRIGRRITMKSVFITGIVQMAATTTGSSPIRLIVFYDKQTNKAAPVATDLLQTDSISSAMLLANSHRFKVLRDIIVPVIGSAGPQATLVREFFKVNLETEFIDGAGAGTVADITSGGLFCLAYANNNTAAAALLTGLNARVRFTDQ